MMPPREGRPMERRRNRLVPPMERPVAPRVAEERQMLARSLVLTALVASLVSSSVAFAVARLSLPPSAQAEPVLQTIPQTLRANRFEIVDAAGTVRGYLGMAGNSSVVLDMLDHGGETRLRLSLLSVGSTDPAGPVVPGLRLFGQSGADATMVVGPDGTMRLALTDPGPDGTLKGAVDISMDAVFPPAIRLLGERALVLWQAP
jgi:hypothetical protein